MPSKSVVHAVPERVFIARRPAADDRHVVAVVAPSYGLERMSYMMPSDSHRYVWMRRLPLQSEAADSGNRLHNDGGAGKTRYGCSSLSIIPVISSVGRLIA
jgi:hypothetical protein